MQERPPYSRERPTAPGPRSARRSHKTPGEQSLGVVLKVVLVALLVGMVLTGDRLGATARAMEFGPARTVAMVVAAPAEWLNHLLGIDRIRETIREIATAKLEPQQSLGNRRPGSTETTGTPSGETTGTPGGSVPGDEPAAPPVTPPGPVFRNPNPSAEYPLTVMIHGDSMTEAFGKYLKNDLIATGLAQAVHDFRYSSGIARPDFFDWPAHLTQTMADQDPDVVVMMIGANDGQDLKVNGVFMAFGSPEWTELYSERVGQAMDIMAVDGRRVYWVGLPIARSETYSAKMKTLDAVYKAEADKRELVEYIDTWALFSTASGQYTAYLPDSSGTSQLMRRDDGIHLTVAGATFLTEHLMKIISEDYDLVP